MAGARVFETIREVDVVALYKTGTATAGEFTLLETVGDASGRTCHHRLFRVGRRGPRRPGFGDSIRPEAPALPGARPPR